MSNQVPEGWTYSTLSELCTFTGGSAFKEIYQGEQSGKYPFIKVSDMNLPVNNRFIVDATNWISSESLKLMKAKTFPKNSIVFAKVGAALLLNRRRILTRDTCIDNNMMAAKPKADDHHFLYYLLQDIDLGKIVQSGAVPSVNQGQMNDICTLIPPLPEQQKIAKILTSVDEVIEKTQAQIDKLKDLKTGMMQELLTQGVGVDGKPHTEFKDSPVGRIPKTWKVAPLGHVAKLTSGGTPSREIEAYWGGSIPWVKTGEINYSVIRSSEEYITEDGLSNSSAKLVPAGTILMAMYGQGITRGKVAILGIEASLNQACLAIIPTGVLNRDFLYFYLTKQYEYLRSLVQEGAQKNLSASIVKELSIPLPSIQEQADISSAFKAVQSNIDDKLSKLGKFNLLKKALMQDLLTGKVRVAID